MAKISYSKLGLKVNTDINKFTFNNNEIEVLKYLPVEDKYDLVMVALQKSLENGIYNEIKLNMYFNLFLVYMYTNITFTEKQREDECKLYDCLMSNGFFDVFLPAMEENEYNELLEMVDVIKADKITYNSTLGYIVKTIINDMPGEAEKAASILNNFKAEDFEKIISLAKATGQRN